MTQPQEQPVPSKAEIGLKPEAIDALKVVQDVVKKTNESGIQEQVTETGVHLNPQVNAAVEMVDKINRALLDQEAPDGNGTYQDLLNKDIAEGLQNLPSDASSDQKKQVRIDAAVRIEAKMKQELHGKVPDEIWNYEPIANKERLSDGSSTPPPSETANELAQQADGTTQTEATTEGGEAGKDQSAQEAQQGPTTQDVIKAISDAADLGVQAQFEAMQHLNLTIEGQKMLDKLGEAFGKSKITEHVDLTPEEEQEIQELVKQELDGQQATPEQVKEAIEQVRRSRIFVKSVALARELQNDPAKREQLGISKDDPLLAEVNSQENKNIATDLNTAMTNLARENSDVADIQQAATNGDVNKLKEIFSRKTFKELAKQPWFRVMLIAWLVALLSQGMLVLPAAAVPLMIFNTLVTAPLGSIAGVTSGGAAFKGFVYNPIHTEVAAYHAKKKHEKDAESKESSSTQQQQGQPGAVAVASQQPETTQLAQDAPQSTQQNQTEPSDGSSSAGGGEPTQNEAGQEPAESAQPQEPAQPPVASEQPAQPQPEPQATSTTPPEAVPSQAPEPPQSRPQPPAGQPGGPVTGK